MVMGAMTASGDCDDRLRVVLPVLIGSVNRMYHCCGDDR